MRRLRESEAIKKRSWNVDNCSKLELGEAVHDVLLEIRTRRKYLPEHEPKPRGHSVHEREDAANQPITGESVN